MIDLLLSLCPDQRPSADHILRNRWLLIAPEEEAVIRRRCKMCWMLSCDCFGCGIFPLHARLPRFARCNAHAVKRQYDRKLNGSKRAVSPINHHSDKLLRPAAKRQLVEQQHQARPVGPLNGPFPETARKGIGGIGEQVSSSVIVQTPTTVISRFVDL